MKAIFSSSLFLLLSIIAPAQDFQSEFNRHFQSGDTSSLYHVLQQWEQAAPKDAELFTSYFNYYFLKSRQEVLAMSRQQPEGASISIKDSSGNTAAYLGGDHIFIKDIMAKGLLKIDQGIALYPNRLDMRFGKIYALGQIKDWSRFTDEIIKTVEYSSKNHNQWTWSANESREDGREFFLSALQDYQLQLYNTGDDALLLNMRRIAETILQYYPDHIESLSNLSISYLIMKDYDQAIKFLLQAEQLAPTDAVVLANLARGYQLKGDTEMALEYYEKTSHYGDEETARFARQQIEALRQ